MQLPPLWKHQIEAIERAKERDDFALFFSTGTGKSRTLLEILRHKYNTNKRILRTIIFTPIITQRNWLNEISTYTKIPKDKFFSLEGTGTNKCKIFDREALLGCSITGWMDNPEILFNPEIQQEGAKKVLEINEKILIIN